MVVLIQSTVVCSIHKYVPLIRTKPKSLVISDTLIIYYSGNTEVRWPFLIHGSVGLSGLRYYWLYCYPPLKIMHVLIAVVFVVWEVCWFVRLLCSVLNSGTIDQNTLTIHPMKYYSMTCVSLNTFNLIQLTARYSRRFHPTMPPHGGIICRHIILTFSFNTQHSISNVKLVATIKFVENPGVVTESLGCHVNGFAVTPLLSSDLVSCSQCCC